MIIGGDKPKTKKPQRQVTVTRTYDGVWRWKAESEGITKSADTKLGAIWGLRDMIKTKERKARGNRSKTMGVDW